jgi:hypothetical protein
VSSCHQIVLLQLALPPRVTKKSRGTSDNESNDILFPQLAKKYSEKLSIGQKLARGDIEPPTSLGHRGSRLTKRDKVNGVIDCEQLGSVFVVCKMTTQKNPTIITSDLDVVKFGIQSKDLQKQD